MPRKKWQVASNIYSIMAAMDMLSKTAWPLKYGISLTAVPTELLSYLLRREQHCPGMTSLKHLSECMPSRSPGLCFWLFGDLPTSILFPARGYPSLPLLPLSPRHSPLSPPTQDAEHNLLQDMSLWTEEKECCFSNSFSFGFCQHLRGRQEKSPGYLLERRVMCVG